jgi:hypothetical protein
VPTGESSKLAIAWKLAQEQPIRPARKELMTDESDDAARPMTRTSVTSGEEWAPDWVIRLPDLSSVAVPEHQKDEFTHRVLEAIRARHGHGNSGETVTVGQRSRVHEWRLNTADGRNRPRLWILNRRNALELFLAGDGEPVGEDIAAWRAAVDTALSYLGGLEDHRWMAILSEVKTSTPTGPSRLSAPASASGLELRILDGCVAEDHTVTPPFGMGRYVHQWFHWPIRVDGTTGCYVWNEDGQRRALERLRHVSAILSLAWDSCWAVREGPRPPDASFAGARQPLMGRSWEPVPPDSPLAIGRPNTVPAWLADAEQRIRGDASRRIQSALLMQSRGHARRGRAPIARPRLLRRLNRESRA